MVEVISNAVISSIIKIQVINCTFACKQLLNNGRNCLKCCKSLLRILGYYSAIDSEFSIYFCFIFKRW